MGAVELWNSLQGALERLEAMANQRKSPLHCTAACTAPNSYLRLPSALEGAACVDWPFLCWAFLSRSSRTTSVSQAVNSYQFFQWPLLSPQLVVPVLALPLFWIGTPFSMVMGKTELSAERNFSAVLVDCAAAQTAVPAAWWGWRAGVACALTVKPQPPSLQLKNAVMPTNH